LKKGISYILTIKLALITFCRLNDYLTGVFVNYNFNKQNTTLKE